jgi:uncharacterized protein YneF (UPF0154 family)
MMSVSTMIQVPLLIPLIVGLFIKKTPQWAPWATVVLGLFVSWLMKDVITPQLVASWMGLNELTAREVVDMNLMVTLAAHLFITAGFFCSTTLFYTEEKDNYRLLRQDFFTDLETPVVADEDQGGYDQQQRDKLGTMVMLMGGGILLMALIPNPMWGRLIFVMCSLSISAIGFLLKRNARTEMPKPLSET